MARLNVSNTTTKFAPFSYTIKEIVGDFLREKVDKDARDFIVDELGIDTVYKSFDLERVDFNSKEFQEPEVFLNDMYVDLAGEVLKKSNLKSKMDFLITINDYTQYLDPAPTVEMVSRLGLDETIRTQNIQGLACSSFSEALLNSAGNFLLSPDKEHNTLVLIGSQYSPWFLDIVKRNKRISRDDKRSFYELVYFLIFSDAVASAVVSPHSNSDTIVEIDHEKIISRKDSSPEGYKKAILKVSASKTDRISFDMRLDPARLKNVVGTLSKNNIEQLQKKFPDEFEKVKSFGLHTAGARFINHVMAECKIDKERSKLSHTLMRETGNTGAASSIQFIEEVVKRKILEKDDWGCYIDYGWEGADAFLFKIK